MTPILFTFKSFLLFYYNISCVYFNICFKLEVMDFFFSALSNFFFCIEQFFLHWAIFSSSPSPHKKINLALWNRQFQKDLSPSVLASYRQGSQIQQESFNLILYFNWQILYCILLWSREENRSTRIQIIASRKSGMSRRRIMNTNFSKRVW